MGLVGPRIIVSFLALEAAGPALQLITRQLVVEGSRDGLSVERLTGDREVASSSPGRSGGGIFFSRVNFLC